MRYQTFKYNGKSRHAVTTGVNEFGNYMCFTPDGYRTFKPGLVENLEDFGEFTVDEIEKFLKPRLSEDDLRNILTLIEEHVDDEREVAWDDGHIAGCHETEVDIADDYDAGYDAGFADGYADAQDEFGDD